MTELAPPIGPPHWSPQLIEAALALHDNRLDIAERLLKAYLKADPFDARAIRMLAELAGADRPLADAENLCAGRSRSRPNSSRRAPTSHWCWGGWAGRPKRSSYSTTFSPPSQTTLGHWNLKAATLGRLGDFEQAIQLYEDVLARSPRPSRVCC